MKWRAFLLTACCMATACAGPVRTRYGSLPPATVQPASPSQSPTLPYSPLAQEKLTSVSFADPATDPETRKVVTDILRDSGIAVVESSPYELHIGLSARPDTVGIFAARGEPVAAPRKQRLLQSCRNNGYRLALAVTDRSSGAIVAHGWAEESHCAASLASVLPMLARQSVAMLIRPSDAGSTLRWTQD